MYVVISKFQVANGMSQEVREALINRPHKVDKKKGLLRMDVLQPMNNNEEFWLITHWDDEHSWEVWYRSHAYQESHEGIPSGLKLEPAGTEIRHFELIPA